MEVKLKVVRVKIKNVCVMIISKFDILINTFVQLYMSNHIKNNNVHKLLYYNKRYSYCNKHTIEYILYCSQSKPNVSEKTKNCIIIIKMNRILGGLMTIAKKIRYFFKILGGGRMTTSLK